MISWAKFRITPEQERMFHAVRVKASPGLNAISESVIHDMAVLDSKSAALLTFISVVIAGLGPGGWPRSRRAPHSRGYFRFSGPVHLRSLD